MAASSQRANSGWKLGKSAEMVGVYVAHRAKVVVMLSSYS
jgi:hypothetical protein